MFRQLCGQLRHLSKQLQVSFKNCFLDTGLSRFWITKLLERLTKMWTKNSKTRKFWDFWFFRSLWWLFYMIKCKLLFETFCMLIQNFEVFEFYETFVTFFEIHWSVKQLTKFYFFSTNLGTFWSFFRIETPIDFQNAYFILRLFALESCILLKN